MVSSVCEQGGIVPASLARLLAHLLEEHHLRWCVVAMFVRLPVFTEEPLFVYGVCSTTHVWWVGGSPFHHAPCRLPRHCGGTGSPSSLSSLTLSSSFSARRTARYCSLSCVYLTACPLLHYTLETPSSPLPPPPSPSLSFLSCAFNLSPLLLQLLVHIVHVHIAYACDANFSTVQLL